LKYELQFELERQTQSVHSEPVVAGDSGEETINRSCLVLLFSLLAGLCDDVYRRSLAIVWVACGSWIG
jgi:hypothetical protein